MKPVTRIFVDSWQPNPVNVTFPSHLSARVLGMDRCFDGKIKWPEMKRKYIPDGIDEILDEEGLDVVTYRFGEEYMARLRYDDMEALFHRWVNALQAKNVEFWVYDLNKQARFLRSFNIRPAYCLGSVCHAIGFNLTREKSLAGWSKGPGARQEIGWRSRFGAEVTAKILKSVTKRIDSGDIKAP